MQNSTAQSMSRLLCVLLLGAFLHSSGTAAMTYGVGARCSSGVYQVDFDSRTVSWLFDTDISWIGATDGDPRHANTFYATPYDGGSLYRVDVVNKKVAAVGSYGRTRITGLAYDEVDDILYATDYKSLYTIDIMPGSPTEGEPNLIGAFKACGEAWAFDYDASRNKLVIMTQACGGTKTYYIDRETCEADYVGFTCNRRITDIWYDDDSGKMFGVGNEPWRGGKLYQIDSETGWAVKKGCIEFDLLGLGKPCDNPVPEPATVAVLGLGSLLVTRRRR